MDMFVCYKAKLLIYNFRSIQKIINLYILAISLLIMRHLINVAHLLIIISFFDSRFLNVISSSKKLKHKLKVIYFSYFFCHIGDAAEIPLLLISANMLQTIYRLNIN